MHSRFHPITVLIVALSTALGTLCFGKPVSERPCKAHPSAFFGDEGATPPGPFPGRSDHAGRGAALPMGDTNCSRLESPESEAAPRLHVMIALTSFPPAPPLAAQTDHVAEFISISSIRVRVLSSPRAPPVV